MMTKSAVEKYRNRRNGHVPSAHHEIGADVEFTNIVLKISPHAPMTLARSMGGQYDKLDAIHFDGAFLQSADDLVITARER